MPESKTHVPNPLRRRLVKLPLLTAVPYIASATQSVDPRAVASMLMLGFLGANPDSTSARSLANDIAKQRVGGVCFLGHNTKSRAGIESLTAMFHAAAKELHPFIAVDQEGGAVQRLSSKNGYSAFPRAQTVAKNHSPREATEIYLRLARVLRTAGFNLNLAPVIDLGVETQNPVVYRWGRTYGDEAYTVAEYATAFIDAHRQANVLTAVKHFPGHGSTRVDSHATPVDLSATWTNKELIPFQLLAESNHLDIVMSGHLSHKKITGGLPATLSKQAVSLLRHELAYQGVLMTDDLDMKAIRSAYSLIDAVIRSIEAGYDLILLSNSLKPDPHLPQRVITAVIEAVKVGRLSANSIHESAERISRLKQTIAQRTA